MNDLMIPYWLSGRRRAIQPIAAPLEGAWRLTSLWRYRDDTGYWYVPYAPYWGPKDVVFENNIVTIHTPHDAWSVHYDYLTTMRYLMFQGRHYFISELTEKELVLHTVSRTGPMKCVLTRIDPAEIHEKIAAPVLAPSDLSGLWWVDAEYAYAGGAWRLRTDFRNEPGMYFWDIAHLPYWADYRFGYSHRQHGDQYTSLNEPYFIIRQTQSWRKSLFFHPVVDGQDHWAYLLDSMTGDWRDSRTKFHLTRIDRTQKDLFVESLLWAESGLHQTTAADKIPVDLLRLWSAPNPEQTAHMLTGGRFLEHPEKYRSAKYAGVYVFLHYFVNYKQAGGKDDPIDAASAYLHYHEILRLWFSLYDMGQMVKNCCPFSIKRYSELLATLRQAAANDPNL